MYNSLDIILNKLFWTYVMKAKKGWLSYHDSPAFPIHSVSSDRDTISKKIGDSRLFGGK